MSNDNRITEVKSVNESGLGYRFISFKTTQIIVLVFGILEVLIGLRILLKLIGANPDGPIVTLIYGITTPFLAPFLGLIGSPTIGNMVLEGYSMFAITIYALIALALKKLIWVIFSRPPRGSVIDITETTTSEHHPTP
ncbi:MAG TPA: hypothetical protein VLA72_12845 [Anaerolineales bacterium]|nr:hypothetical protein [Anaerolineales bacterium]